MTDSCIWHYVYALCQAKNYLLLFQYENSLKCLKSLLKSQNPLFPHTSIKKSLNYSYQSNMTQTQYSFLPVFPQTNAARRQAVYPKILLLGIRRSVILPKALHYRRYCFQTVLELLHEEEPEIFADSISIEEENCEILYNLAFCSLCSDSSEAKSHALMILEELSEVLNEKHRGS